MPLSQKSHTRRAIVIGGSIGGLFVGAFLRRIGWRVDIYERSSIELIGAASESLPRIWNYSRPSTNVVRARLISASLFTNGSRSTVSVR
jgi:2-polyprenyl-6-methoxyphenol hydroxylase-like FAD-dependent oxidoreductase